MDDRCADPRTAGARESDAGSARRHEQTSPATWPPRRCRAANWTIAAEWLPRTRFRARELVERKRRFYMVQHVTIVPKPHEPDKPETHPHTVTVWRDDQTIKWGLS